jgi:hypothetical protein
VNYRPESLDADRPPPDAEDAERLVLLRTWSRRPGLYGWLVTTDHKALGLRFVVTAFVFFLLGGVLALSMRMQLALPEGKVLGPDLYNQAFTTHGTTMMLMLESIPTWLKSPKFFRSGLCGMLRRADSASG